MEEEEGGVVVADLWTEDGKTPYGLTQLSSAGGFQEKGWDYCTKRSG